MTMTAAESRFSFLTLPLAVYLFGYVVWLGDRVTLHAPALARPGPRRAQARLRQRQFQPRARAPLPRPSLRRDLQDHHGDHHGLYADPDALTGQR